jgi:ribosomal protein S20
MLVSGISSDTNLYRTANPQMRSRQIRDNFQQLTQAFQSGNLSGAQQAFATLQQLIPNLSADNQTQNSQISSSQSLFRTDLKAIGQALKSGDLSAAKAAFTKLQQDIQSVNKGHKSYPSS